MINNTSHLDNAAGRPEFCIHALIEAQVERTPEAVAIIFESESLSYREFNRRANQLARRLQACGVGPEVTVAVCMERCLELAVAVLGLLKAGGVLVPIDPDSPPERLQSILEQTAPAVILTRRATINRLSDYRGAVICLDEAGEAIEPDDPGNPDSRAVADNLCAIFFTSGSTGTPKGVLVPHRVSRRVQWAQDCAIPLGRANTTAPPTNSGE